MFWLAQFFTIGVILCLTYGIAGEYDDKPHILTLSFANLANDNSAKWVIVLSQYWFVGCTVVFTMWKQKGMDAYKLEAEEEGGRHTSLNTVWISGITVGTSEEKLASWFESEYKGEVMEAKMVWDVNALGHNIRGRRRLIMKMVHGHNVMRKTSKARSVMNRLSLTTCLATPSLLPPLVDARSLGVAVCEVWSLL